MKLKSVNILQGTKNTYRYSHGNVLPLCALPHGLDAFCVQTEEAKSPWWFDPDDCGFEGFRLTHQPSPWIGDYGHLVVSAASRKCARNAGSRYAQYDNAHAVFQPHWLCADLLSEEIRAELTPADTGCVMRFSFRRPERYIDVFLFEGEGSLRVAGNTLYGTTAAAAHVEGPPLVTHFLLRFSAPVEEAELFEGEEALAGASAQGRKLSARLRFSASVVEARLSTSYLSAEQAELNYAREISGSFEEVRGAAAAAWERALGCLEVETDENTERTVASCLYRAMLFPRRFYERDGRGRPFHPHAITHRPVPGVAYTDNGFWDTYRTLFPFLSLVDPVLYAEMLEGFCLFSEESGALPRWLSPFERGTMPGSCLEAVIADACVKDILPRGLAERFVPVLEGQTERAYADGLRGRIGIEDYLRLGYVPYEAAGESVSRTLDYAYADHCVAVFRKKLGLDAEALEARALSYRNLFDRNTGFFRARARDGAWREPFDPEMWGGDYTEACAWQNRFSVPHDLGGLAELFGGVGGALAAADALFSQPAGYKVGGYGHVIHEMCESLTPDLGQCAICNQPSFHLPWLYAAYGVPEKTEALLGRALAAFSDGPTGYPGDEDNGATATWYLFGMLGLYPYCPSDPTYLCVTPRVDGVLRCARGDLRFEKGKKPSCSRIRHADAVCGRRTER